VIHLERIGRYLETDTNGFVLPDVAAEKIDPAFRAVIDWVAPRVFAEAGATAFYIRGSVPRGLAIPGISDIDLLFATPARDLQWEEAIEAEVVSRFPLVRGAEVSGMTPAELGEIYRPQSRPYLQMLLKTQSLHLAGEDPVRDVAPFRCGIDLFSHAFFLEREYEKLPQKLATQKSESEIQAIRRWYCRRLVRAGLEITLDRVPRFTRDLYLCYEQFAQVYPERESAMLGALENALNGHADPIEYGELVRWIAAETRRRFSNC
jgi:hypothetical protein